MECSDGENGADVSVVLNGNRESCGGGTPLRVLSLRSGNMPEIVLTDDRIRASSYNHIFMNGR